MCKTHFKLLKDSKSRSPLKVLILLVLPALLISLAACEKLTDTTTIRLAHGLSTSHPVHEAMIFMADLADEKSDGKMRIKVYPNQQLGSERELLELVQIGSVGMTKISSGALENFVPEMRVFGLPYLFGDEEHIESVLMGEIGQQLLLAGEPYWLRGLTYYDAGKRSFYTIDRPIKTPDDLQGMNIRVMQSQMAVNMMRELGGSPTPISFGELYTALQQGVVDGAENNPPSFLTSRHYEVAKYYSLDEHTMLPDVVIIGTEVWDNLNTQEQQWLQESADSSAVFQKQLWLDAETEALETVQKAGVEIIYPDKKPFIEATRAIYEQFKQNEPDIYKLVEQIQNLQ
ncbi:TRAP transporter substrate-binding protein [Rhodohalobacter sp. 8-1]|uniref:TRAP transporter substrate-binding protein n=1 Tax=Rhodohalobacter sp. 8-1 TaxID=3131972 RepID=UPI0030ED220E